MCGALDPGTCYGGGGGEVGPRLRQTFFALAQEEAQRYAGTIHLFWRGWILMLFTQEGMRSGPCVRPSTPTARAGHVTALDAQLPVDVTVRCGVHTGPLACPACPRCPGARPGAR